MAEEAPIVSKSRFHRSQAEDLLVRGNVARHEHAPWHDHLTARANVHATLALVYQNEEAAQAAAKEKTQGPRIGTDFGVNLDGGPDSEKIAEALGKILAKGFGTLRNL